MGKCTVGRVFVASLLGLAASLVLMGAAGLMAYPRGNLVTQGPDVVGYDPADSA